MLYDCRDVSGFLGVALLWIHPHPPESVQSTVATYGQQYCRGGHLEGSQGVQLPQMLTRTMSFCLKTNEIINAF